jgi:hypothetical protein
MNISQPEYLANLQKGAGWRSYHTEVILVRLEEVEGLWPVGSTQEQHPKQ